MYVPAPACADAEDALCRRGALQVTLLNFTQALITQPSQTAVCNLHHSVHQQLCPRNALRILQ